MKNVQIYIQQVIALAGSLVIKSETIARAMNLPLEEYGLSAPDDRRKWRYYLHLNGEYFTHANPNLTDKPVTLTSLDDGTEIELTKEILKSHKKTSNVYRYNPEYISRLVKKYPEMTVFIRGVFNPISLERSIGAEDCTILYHDSSLVEKQEASLLLEVSRWLRNVHRRFFYEGYVVSNDVFITAFWINVYAMLPARIKLIRSRLTHTQETHSFHIEQFLASHQYLHEFLPYLTLHQKMYLYRNIRYIERNTGKEEVLQKLVEVFLTGWDMPTSTYDVGQLIHSVEDGELLPNPTVQEVPMNFKEQQNGRDAALVDTRELLQKEVGLAYDNVNNFDEYLTDLDTRLQYTQYPDQPTKVIEVTAVDPAELDPFRIEEVLVNEWLHTAALGTYDVYHEILNPLNGDTLRLTTKELFVLFHYSAYKGYSGYSEEVIPKYIAAGIQLKRWANRDEYEKFLPKSWLGRWDNLIDFYTDTHHEIYSNIITADELYTNAKAILKAKTARHRYGYNLHRTEARVAAKAAFNYNYFDVSCDLGLEEKTYAEFFAKFGVDYEQISEESWQDIAVDALNAATAFEDNAEISHKDIQSAMVRLLTRLSSYTIHFASRMSTDAPIVTDPLLQTIGTSDTEAEGHNFADRPTTTVQSLITESYGISDTPPLVQDILAHDVPQEVEVYFDQTIGLSVEVEELVVFEINHPSTDLEKEDVNA
tara:strand:- start:1832 stop:3949 length:2118 start_codon:yes stop_codon:yes gene_type:complete